MNREMMHQLSAAVDNFAAQVTGVGPEVCFQCSTSTKDREDPVLSYWGCQTGLDLESFESLISAVLVQMAKQSRWTKEDLAGELVRMSAGIFRMTFGQGEDMTPAEKEALEHEGLEKMHAAAALFKAD